MASVCMIATLSATVRIADLNAVFAVLAATAAVNPSWISMRANFVKLHVDVTELRIASSFLHSNVLEYIIASVQVQ